MRALRTATIVVLSASTSADAAPLFSERFKPEVLRSFDPSSLFGVS